MIKFPNVITRYHGATDYKPSRISASAEGYDRVYVSYDHSLTVTANHKAAAIALANSNGWIRDGIKLSGSEMPKGNGYAFVFTATEAKDKFYTFSDLRDEGCPHKPVYVYRASSETEASELFKRENGFDPINKLQNCGCCSAFWTEEHESLEEALHFIDELSGRLMNSDWSS